MKSRSHANFLAVLFSCLIFPFQIIASDPTNIELLKVTFYSKTGWKKMNLESESLIMKYIDVQNHRHRTEVLSYDANRKSTPFWKQESTTGICGLTSCGDLTKLIRGDTLWILNPSANAATYQSVTKKAGSWKDGAALDGKTIGQERILGRECMIVETTTGKYWVWNGLVLKRNIKIGAIRSELIATEIIVNKEIPADKFKIAPNMKRVPFEEQLAKKMDALAEKILELKDQQKE